MKKVLLLMMILFTAVGAGMAQQNKQDEKAARKAEKAAKKAAEEASEMAMFEEAVKALEAKDFVLEAERVEFKRGNFAYVTPSTNFVSLAGEQAVIQLAFNGVFSGPNGLGGITVEGTATHIEMNRDKRGNVSFSMMVQGTAVSAQVTFRMMKGTSRCSVTVSPNFNSNRLTFTGRLYPTELSNVFQGRTF